MAMGEKAIKLISDSVLDNRPPQISILNMVIPNVMHNTCPNGILFTAQMSLILPFSVRGI